MTANRIAALCFAVLAAATIAALVVSQNVRSSLIVDKIELTNRFDPSHRERARIRFRLTEVEERATVEVIDEEEVVVETLLEGEPLGDFEIHRLRWNPRGERLPDGDYRVRLTLRSLDREIVLPERIVLRRSDG